MKHFAPIILATLALTCAAAMAQRTSRPGARVAAMKSAPAATATADTIVSPTDITVRGYDKPLRSRRESFFVTNNNDTDTLRAISVTIDYKDSSGRQLHRAVHRLACDIPPHQTRQLTYKAWDTQQKFYYTRSDVPNTTAQASPFDVAISVDTAFVNRQPF